MDLILYANDNGVVVKKVDDNTDPVEWITKRQIELGDDPFVCSFFHIWQGDSGLWYGEYIWNPDWDEAEMSFDEINEGHPGHPHEYGDS
ncbi:MAG: hypothetical protein ACXABN_17930 [Candidatus Thorarchaeota archaeon]|jgi:hypothetical protein